MISKIILQAIVLCGTVQISKPFAHLIFLRLCINIVLPEAVIVFFTCSNYSKLLVTMKN